MTKTNRERALDILVAHSRQADFIGNDPYVTVDCIGIQREITAALDKEERHGARKAHAKAILENCYLTDEAELVCKPQPEPQRYTIEEAVRLANELSHAVFVYAGYSSDKNNREITKATEAIVQAITGQPKQAQFDAEKVKIMLGFLRNNTYAAGKYNHPIDNEASELVYRNILAALGLEE